MATVALIGPNQQDNLSLRYLAAALEAAGHAPFLVPYNHRRDLPSCLDQIRETAPDIAGLGISFQFAVNDYLALAAALREDGFAGHLTCGGHVPTFCYNELLRDAPALDSAVRHEGEQTLCALADAIEAGRSLFGINGLVHREGARIEVEPPRTPVQDLDILPAPSLRNRDAFFVGGVPIAFLLAARGCYGACAYCSIQSFSRDAGGRRLRLREIGPVAEEMVAHYRARQVRTFFFQDDLFILTNKKRTVSRIRALSAALDERGIPAPVLWVKGRPESISEEIAQEAAAAGVVHMFLGIENASDARLRYLGRTHAHTHNLSAIRHCEAHGIRPSFNFMMFDPDCTVEDVGTTVEFAASVPHLPWNLCRTEIYSGTPLLDRLRAEGRLTGDYRSFGYRMQDDACERMFRILRVSLHERAFAESSLLNRLISLSFARQAHEAFFPGPATDEISRAVDALIIEAHTDTAEELRRTLDFVTRPNACDASLQAHAVREALRINQKNKMFYERFQGLWSLLNARGEALYPKRAISSASSRPIGITGF